MPWWLDRIDDYLTYFMPFWTAFGSVLVVGLVGLTIVKHSGQRERTKERNLAEAVEWSVDKLRRVTERWVGDERDLATVRAVLHALDERSNPRLREEE